MMSFLINCNQRFAEFQFLDAFSIYNHFKNRMSHNQQRIYMKIGLQTRKKVVQLMGQEGKPPKQVAELLNLKISTVKAIYRKFQSGDGFFLESKEDKMKRQIVEEMQRARNINQNEQNQMNQVPYYYPILNQNASLFYQFYQNQLYHYPY